MADRATGDVIPLASRRRAVAAAPVRPPARPPQRRPVAALALGAALLALAVAAGARSRAVADVRALSPSERGRIFARALEDLKTACVEPAQPDGALRDHCRAQAEFLMLFPECDRVCQSMAAGALPHARR